jgi:hypothetical protein
VKRTESSFAIQEKDQRLFVRPEPRDRRRLDEIEVRARATVITPAGTQEH